MWVSVSTIGVSFVTLYLALVSIVWTGWRTITEQRRRLESFNATLERQVEERTSELERANRKLADEVSERRRAEEERTQRTLELEKALQELQSTHRQLIQSAKLAAIGELLSGVSHELNNPLTGIWGISRILVDRDMDETLKSEVTLIHKEAERCVRIVQNLLSFVGPHAEGKTYGSINSMVESALQLRQYELTVTNSEIDVQLQPDLPWTTADSHQIQQVVLNLISNAEHAMLEARGGGKLAVKTSQIGDMIHLVVSDDGVGIPKENLGKVFDPFFTTKEVGEGTGLGLSICYRIVQDHGGEITVDSVPDRGTTFTVQLPLTPYDASGSGEPVSQETSSSLRPAS